MHAKHFYLMANSYPTKKWIRLKYSGLIYIFFALLKSDIVIES